MGDEIQPACAPDGDDDYNWQKSATVGWGTLSPGKRAAGTSTTR